MVGRVVTFCLAAAHLVCAEEFSAQREDVLALGKLTAPPDWQEARDRASEADLKAIYFEALDYKGKPTKVFAWLGFPTNRTETVPGIVLVHGGGGTAFSEWVRLWTAKDFAGISIAVEGQTDVRESAAKDSVTAETKNCDRSYIYGSWWKSPQEVRFYLDGKYAYSIKPKVAWDVPAFIQMAVETYDWNPIPQDGGLVDSGTWEQRTTQYDWVRTRELADDPVGTKGAAVEGRAPH